MARVLIKLGLHGVRHNKAIKLKTETYDALIAKWAKVHSDKIKAETIELEYMRQVMGL